MKGVMSDPVRLDWGEGNYWLYFLVWTAQTWCFSYGFAANINLLVSHYAGTVFLIIQLPGN
jgi:hypothetical protein